MLEGHHTQSDITKYTTYTNTSGCGSTCRESRVKCRREVWGGFVVFCQERGGEKETDLDNLLGPEGVVPRKGRQPLRPCQQVRCHCPIFFNRKLEASLDMRALLDAASVPLSPHYALCRLCMKISKKTRAIMSSQGKESPFQMDTLICVFTVSLKILKAEM